MRIWGIHKKYKSLSWWENFMGGHITIGPVTIFGANAMCWTAQIRTKRWGYLCITLPSIARKRLGWPFYIYLSPNGTPWACTYYRGSHKDEVIRARIRKLNFGHNFSTEKHYTELRTLNNKFSWFKVGDYDIEQFGPKNNE